MADRQVTAEINFVTLARRMMKIANYVAIGTATERIIFGSNL
jgi:hypothetical protein